MRAEFAKARVIAGQAIAAMATEMGLEFRVTGSVALDLHNLLQRSPAHSGHRHPRSVNVNLTTSVPHDPDRVRDRLVEALSAAGWPGVTAVQDVRPGSMSRAVHITGQTGGVVLTTTVMPEYTRHSPEISGLAVSAMPTLAIRTVQEVLRRRDARDLIDLAAMLETLGSESIDRWTVAWLEHEAARTGSEQDRLALYDRLHYGLSQVVTLTSVEMQQHGLDHRAPEEVKNKVVLMAGRIAAQASGTGQQGAQTGLERLLSMPVEELNEMRAAAVALGVDLAHVRNSVTSPAALAERRKTAEKRAVQATAELRRRRTAQRADEQARLSRSPESGHHMH